MARQDGRPGVSVLPVAANVDRAGKRHAGDGFRRSRSRGCAAFSCDRAARTRGDSRSGRQASGHAVRRTAAAGCHCARTRQRSSGCARGRADWQPGRADTRLSAGIVRGAQRRRSHGHHRDPRARHRAVRRSSGNARRRPRRRGRANRPCPEGTCAMTPRLFIKLRRDLATIWPRVILMIVALAVTQTMFSGVVYTWGVAGREIRREYLATNPASATLLLDDHVDAARMGEIAAAARIRPKIIDAAPRTQLLLQVQDGDGKWGANPLQIFVASPDDPMRIERLTVEEGHWPPAAGEILIDRSSFELLNLEVGRDVIVQAPNGEPRRLRVSGAVYYPGLAPSFQ